MVSKYTKHGKANITTRQTLRTSTQVRMLAKYVSRENMIIHMTLCTMQNNWHNRQINHSW